MTRAIVTRIQELVNILRVPIRIRSQSFVMKTALVSSSPARVIETTGEFFVIVPSYLHTRPPFDINQRFY